MKKKIAVAAVVLALAGGGVAYAAIPDSDDSEYHACVKNSQFAYSFGHDVRIIDKQAGESCGSGWTEKTWPGTASTGSGDHLTYTRTNTGTGDSSGFMEVRCDESAPGVEDTLLSASGRTTGSTPQPLALKGYLYDQPGDMVDVAGAEFYTPQDVAYTITAVCLDNDDNRL